MLGKIADDIAADSDSGNHDIAASGNRNPGIVDILSG